MRTTLKLMLLVVTVAVLCACNSARHVSEESLLLDKVSIRIDSTSEAAPVTSEGLIPYLRQQPNHKILWSMRLRLGVYNLSGKDTTKWWNRWIRKLGEPPVIYDPDLTEETVHQLKRAMINKGYVDAVVSVDTLIKPGKRKIKVEYDVHPGTPMIIDTIRYDIPDPEIHKFVLNDSSMLPATVGSPLDRDMLESQRELITTRLRNAGYYDFVKDLITFNADTVSGSRKTTLTMKINNNTSESRGFMRYTISRVRVITDYRSDMQEDLKDLTGFDSIKYRGIEIYTSGKPYLRPSVIYDNCFLTPGSVFRQRAVDRTYQAFSRLSILNFINIRCLPVGDTGLLDVYILLTPGKSQSLSVSVEGTNSEGDLGVAVGLGYSHSNVGKGSETLSAKLRGAYEALGGKIEGLLNNRYLEVSGDVAVSFPKFKAPFLKESFKRKINASSELGISLNYQERPEYTRIISTAGWSYKWNERVTGNRHTFTPLDINYVYLPKSTITFIDNISADNPLLRYSYEDHFIMRMGYGFYHTNKKRENPWLKNHQHYIYTVRLNGEIAGNLLFALSSIFDHHSDFHTHPYEIFGIHYAQYFKVEGDYAFAHQFDTRQSVAFHAGGGIGVPYGNSSILPFEKRFYGGGANGVRGWSVRTLGPGSYPGRNSVSDFINQCGDIRISLSAEYRAKLFWVVEGGIFIDAGNIWTIRNYENQPGGWFRFNKFYKQIAAAYGAGIRLDFSYFLLRFDLGMKAHNPATGEEPWPIIHPDWRRDHVFHFSIGYPF